MASDSLAFLYHGVSIERTLMNLAILICMVSGCMMVGSMVGPLRTVIHVRVRRSRRDRFLRARTDECEMRPTKPPPFRCTTASLRFALLSTCTRGCRPSRRWVCRVLLGATFSHETPLLVPFHVAGRIRSPVSFHRHVAEVRDDVLLGVLGRRANARSRATWTSHHTWIGWIFLSTFKNHGIEPKVQVRFSTL